METNATKEIGLYQNKKIRVKLNFNGPGGNIVLAVIIGALTGITAIFFRNLITWSGDGYTYISKGFFGFLPFDLWRIFMPAIAGLVVGLVALYVAKEVKGTGIPEVMEAVALKGGRIRKRVILIKAFASATSIGAGGSVGKVGPIVQIGSALGSVVGQQFNLSTSKIKTCIACGAAAGIAAIFNAPMAGVIFAQEVILGEFASSVFVSIVISAVTASVVTQIFLGDAPAFLVYAYPLNSPTELIFYVVLGILAAFLGLLLVNMLYKTEDFFNRIKILPEWTKPAFGGLIVGLLGLQFPEVLGLGYNIIEATFTNQFLFMSLFLLLVIKMIATSITLGSGHSGGFFAPSLFVGATFGGIVGQILQLLFPTLVVTPGAYAIVGMGAVLAGTTQAPITAVLMIFEMTRDYRVVAPLMISVVFSTLIFSYFSKGESMYTLKLLRKGVNLKLGKDLNIMKQIPIKEVMAYPVEVCREDNKVGKVIKMMHNSKHNGFPVLNTNDELVGMITLQDIREAPVEGIMDELVAKLMSRKLIVTYPNESLDDVFHKFGQYDLGHIPVVSSSNRKQLLGIITRSDLIKAYDKKLLINTGNS